ncbi:elongation factor P hydroxylase [Flocculibacter collagenilyticus]|uniref:elongation factor P hydroxylase n=1 Tax=Flocculibacter collagenilyticus TaxID=2744479 RepID=UPI0018F698F0|nr:elongation factor P hydroxylase [Flocculibacter collagenilyticus]
MHHYSDLITLFDNTFYESFNTRLIKGVDEPVYLPANSECCYHQIVFAHGFFASALHEIAHWCLAGAQRRLQEDYGYWYNGDGRDSEQQAAFEAVEIKPQAIEWALSVAANFNFNVSCDNLDGVEPNRSAFRHKVLQQVDEYLELGFPPRAQQFINVLARFYGTELPLNKSHFVASKRLANKVEEQVY